MRGCAAGWGAERGAGKHDPEKTSQCECHSGGDFGAERFRLEAFRFRLAETCRPMLGHERRLGDFDFQIFKSLNFVAS